MKNIPVKDEMIGLDETIESIEVGKSVSRTGKYVVTQQDIDKGGVIKNVATVGDKTPEKTVTVEQNSSYTATKKADKEKVTTAGEEITYTITVTNTGNTTLKNIPVKDEMIGLDETIESIEVGKSVSRTGKYVVTQQDIDKGGVIKNVATVGDKTPEKTVTVEQNSSYTATKKADKEKVTTAGEEITYTITVTNTGNTTLKNIPVKDKMIGLDTTIESIEVGESKTVTGKYIVTQQDIDKGEEIKNVATVGDKTPEEKTVIEQDSSYTAVKTADKEKVSKVGEEITYTITVTNTGNTTLENIPVKDEMIGLDTIIEKVEVGKSVSRTGKYVVTQQDIDKGGVIKNVATVGDKTPEKTVTVEQNSSYTATKKADKEKVTTAGEEITYTITVTNTGNTTLKNIPVKDDMVGLDTTIETIEVGKSQILTGKYIVEQKDIDKGGVIKNVAIVGDKTPEEETTVEQNSSYTAIKTADKEKVTTVGEKVTYTITVTNTGNTTLKNISVKDDMIKLSTTIGTLGVGKSEKLTGIYTVTQEDIDKGGVIKNVATVGDKTPEKVIIIETTPTIDVQKDVIALTVDGIKSSFENINVSGIEAKQGDTITYKIVATNTGNTTLSNVRVTDNRNVKVESVTLPERLSNIVITTGNQVNKDNNLLGRDDITLQPQESIVLTVSYTLTKSDVSGQNYGKDFINTATADGKYNNTKYDDQDSAEIGTKFVPTTGNKTFVKVWNDKNYESCRPSQIVVQLLKNGKAEGEAVTLKATDNWSKTWNNLPLEDTNGNTITYTVSETAVPGYTASACTINEQGQLTITNTYNKPISGTITKVRTETSTSEVKVPIDVVFVLDTSGSMEGSRTKNMVSAVNKAMKQILNANKNNRVGVVGFSGSSSKESSITGAQTLLKLDKHIAKSGNEYIKSNKNGDEIYTNVNDATKVSRDVTGATYTQMGIKQASDVLTGATNKTVNIDGIEVTRTPVIILVSDGLPTLYTTNYSNVTYGDRKGPGNEKNITENEGYYTILSANYYKNLVGKNYGTTAKMYTIGMGISKDNAYGTTSLNPNSTNITSCSKYGRNSKEYKLYEKLKNENNPYLGKYSYADGAYFGEMTEAQLNDIMNKIIESVVPKSEERIMTETERINGKLELTDININAEFTLKVGTKTYTSCATAIADGVVAGNETRGYYIDLTKIPAGSTITVTYTAK